VTDYSLLTRIFACFLRVLYEELGLQKDFVFNFMLRLYNLKSDKLFLGL
jgi:hypothetical protein